MPRLATIALLLLFACRRESAPANTEPGMQPDPATACVDAQLSAKGLNSYGDPPDTAYAGGTPLFDEKTGKSRDRIEYVLSRRPEIAAVCGRDR